MRQFGIVAYLGHRQTDGNNDGSRKRATFSITHSTIFAMLYTHMRCLQVMSPRFLITLMLTLAVRSTAHGSITSTCTLHTLNNTTDVHSVGYRMLHMFSLFRTPATHEYTIIKVNGYTLKQGTELITECKSYMHHSLTCPV